MFVDPRERGRTHPRPEVRIPGEAFDRYGRLLRVGRGDDESVVVAADEIPSAAHAVGDDDRQAEVHRLAHDETERLAAARKEREGVSDSVGVGDLRAIEEPCEDDIRDSERFHALAKRLLLSPGPDDQKDTAFALPGAPE